MDQRKRTTRTTRDQEATAWTKRPKIVVADAKLFPPFSRLRGRYQQKHPLTFFAYHRRSVFFTLAGALYGAGLLLLGLILTGAGHGTYLVLEIASAPFCYLWFLLDAARDFEFLSVLGIVITLIAPPVMWGAVGWLLGSSSHSHRQIVLVIILVHYLSLLLVRIIEAYPEPSYLMRVFNKDPEYVALAAGLYFLGQLLIWITWFRRRTA